MQHTRNKIKIIFYLLFFTFFSCKSPSQEYKTPFKDIEINKLESSFSSKDGVTFLENFPKNFSSFKNTFGWDEKNDSPKPLYKDSQKYIDYWFLLLQNPANQKYESQIISISKNGHWQADAINYFKDKSLDYIKTKKKYNLINSLTNEDAQSVLEFLLDSPHPKLDTLLFSNLNIEKQEIVKTFFSSRTSIEQKRSKFNSYINNNKYFIKTFDVNKDGFSDKIVSSKPYDGNELFVFFGNKQNEYILSFEGSNFSEDGGNIIQDIYPISNSKGFTIRTSFLDRGYYEKEYTVIPENQIWILKKIVYKTMSDVSKDAVKYICDVPQNIDITKSDWTEKINEIPNEGERNKKCKVEKISNNTPQYFIQDQDGFTNLRAEKNTTSKVLQQVKSGEKIEILDNSSDWFLVKTIEGKKGYVHKSRVKSE